VNLPLIIEPDAEADLAEARDWYASQQEGSDLADAFIECVEDAFEGIARMPELRPELHRGVRRWLVTRFPYAVYYRAEPDRIVVIAVMHTRRDPKRWRGRA
jgi:plasmid stabilization system protein ParE